MQSSSGLHNTPSAALRGTPSAALRSTQRPSPNSTAKRRLDLNNSPPSPSSSETGRPFSLNLTGVCHLLNYFTLIISFI